MTPLVAVAGSGSRRCFREADRILHYLTRVGRELLEPTRFETPCILEGALSAAQSDLSSGASARASSAVL